MLASPASQVLQGTTGLQHPPLVLCYQEAQASSNKDKQTVTEECTRAVALLLEPCYTGSHKSREEDPYSAHRHDDWVVTPQAMV